MRMLIDDTCDKLLYRTPSISNLLYLGTTVCSGDKCKPVEPAAGLPGKPQRRPKALILNSASACCIIEVRLARPRRTLGMSLESISPGPQNRSESLLVLCDKTTNDRIQLESPLWGGQS